MPAMPPYLARLLSLAAAMASTAVLAASPSEPPPPDGRPITPQDRRWWAFQPLQQSTPPANTSADPAHAHPIDQFITARAAEKDLQLNPRAARRTLIRRASFDLTGLPPTPEEVAAFVDDDSPAAWSTVVQRLLDSPRHGERWARHWLDVARFAESSGFEHDYDRPHAYHYRDFVIKALNADMPYDQFVRWQLAGDELEPDNPLALTATGFLGAGVFPTQITASEVERTRYDAMDDMLATTGTAMLGLTIGCARCHDHKFDPIPASDYYRMLSTFTTTVRSEIEVDLDPEGTRRAREAFARDHAPMVEALATWERQELVPKFDAWLAAGATAPAAAVWEQLDIRDAHSQAGATFKKIEDGSLLVEGANEATDVHTLTVSTTARTLRALRLEAMADPSLPHGGPGRADNGNIGLSRIQIMASPRQGGPAVPVAIRQARATFEQNATNLSVASALDDNPQTGWAVDPRFGASHAAVFEFSEPVDYDGGITLEVRLEYALNTRHVIGRPRLAVTSAVNPAWDADSLPTEVAALLQRQTPSDQPATPLTNEERATLFNWWKQSDNDWRHQQQQVTAHAQSAPQPAMTKIMVCAEGYPPVRMHSQGADFFAETHFLSRGSTDLKKGVATPGFLQVLMPESTTESRWHSPPPAGARYSGRRRALAQWITDPQHGAGALLARVIVNRLWQHHFGQGLVTTPNDFGTQGARPSHPELLDWLASELIRGGWRLKPIHHLIMSSSTYQQDTRLQAGALHADPANTLFARRTMRRLEAEAVVDSLLFVSGRLDPVMFGPGTLDNGSRRRSIYFTIKRSQMIPSMQAFDAPEPLVSQGQRQTTTVAPQALMLMNSAQARSWAEGFAARFAPEPDLPPATAVTAAYTLALNRAPDDRERADAIGFIESQTTRHQSSGAANARTLALIDFAQVVLSLNEFIYVD